MAPVPKAAERLRSETLVLLPSQWSCMPSFGPWRKTEGKSTTPMRSASGIWSKFQFSSALAGLKVSKRPGPKVGSLCDEVVEAVDDGEQPLADHADADELERQAVDEVELEAHARRSR